LSGELALPRSGFGAGAASVPPSSRLVFGGHTSVHPAGVFGWTVEGAEKPLNGVSIGRETGSEYGHGTGFQPKKEVPVWTEGLNQLEMGYKVFCAHAAPMRMAFVQWLPLDLF